MGTGPTVVVAIELDNRIFPYRERQLLCMKVCMWCFVLMSEFDRKCSETGGDLEPSSHWYRCTQKTLASLARAGFFKPRAPSVNKSLQGKNRDKAQNKIKREQKENQNRKDWKARSLVVTSSASPNKR